MLHTGLTGGLGYEGKVTLTLKCNDKVLKSKTYKNKGTAQLFRFLGYCLMGAFEEAKKLVPVKILLLQNNSSYPDADKPKEAEVRTDWQYYTQTPTLISDSSHERVSITYNFEIPRAAIYGPFNQIALYGAGMNSSADYLDFSAYYFLKDEFGAFDTQNPASWSATTVLLIDWELTISNNNVDLQNSGEEAE